jgi:hypothetical protein
MDEIRFDDAAKAVAERRSRREVLKGLLGLGVAATVASVGIDGSDAARRGFSGPPFPGKTPAGPCIPSCGEDVCEISDGCGGTCSCQEGDFCIEGECKFECPIELCPQ